MESDINIFKMLNAVYMAMSKHACFTAGNKGGEG